MSTHQVDLNHPAETLRSKLSTFMEYDASAVDQSINGRKITQYIIGVRSIGNIQLAEVQTTGKIRVCIHAGTDNPVARCQQLLRDCATDAGATTSNHSDFLGHTTLLLLI
ncbi:hypothetical protein D3C78_1382580 [compost metagenome]